LDADLTELGSKRLVAHIELHAQLSERGARLVEASSISSLCVSELANVGAALHTMSKQVLEHRAVMDAVVPRQLTKRRTPFVPGHKLLDLS
jgi:hypothetical protein